VRRGELKMTPRRIHEDGLAIVAKVKLIAQAVIEQVGGLYTSRGRDALPWGENLDRAGCNVAAPWLLAESQTSVRAVEKESAGGNAGGVIARNRGCTFG